ncbi:MAG: hypothetical protein VZQ98_14035 [Bacteroidales bacterium]|nr:hypothetical protein [Bacteroidales bacterium]
MDNIISTYYDYSICKLSFDELNELAEFVVSENYKHHKKQSYSMMSHRNEIDEVLKDEILFYGSSHIIVVRNKQDRIVGTIRLMKWDGRVELPITKFFGINPKDLSINSSNTIVWHMGRFAVSSEIKDCRNELFRLLIFYALAPICRVKDSILLAECDSKLFHVASYLGLNVIALDEGKEILGSTTIPMYATRDGMTEFIMNNCSLALHIGTF